MSRTLNNWIAFVIGIAVVVLFIAWTNSLLDTAHRMLCDEGTLKPEHCTEYVVQLQDDE